NDSRSYRNAKQTNTAFWFIQQGHEVPQRKVHPFGFQGRGGSPNRPGAIEVNRPYLCYVAHVTETAPKRTPLYDEHVRLGAKMVPFAGWLMPVQYTSIVEEHQAVRNNIGMFDISHMGQLIVSGSGARDWLNMMMSNPLTDWDL